MTSLRLKPTRCAICGTRAAATVLYPANFTIKDLNPAVFSARRLPDRLHYRLVVCRTCCLVRSDPVASAATLAKLYHHSRFTYATHLKNLTHTYIHYLDKVPHTHASHPKLLEIGCGNGFFLKVAKKKGYDVYGIEPSTDAVKKAPASLKPHLKTALLKPGLFPKESFDVICLFQVFDHLPDPGTALDTIHAYLKPGGHLLYLHHNVAALPARILKEKSPIIDIEHTYLYSPATMERLLIKHRFHPAKAGRAFSRHSLLYLTRLLPFPLSIKKTINRVLKSLHIDQLPLYLPLGNLYGIAQKPHYSSTVAPFNDDTTTHGSYRYTHNAPLSSRHANARLTRATKEVIKLKGKRVIDIGCGDGTYTENLMRLGKPAAMIGLDPAQNAIKHAQSRYRLPKLRFLAASAYHLPFAENSFDIAVIRGVLHHLDYPVSAIAEASRVAKTVVIIDPNGYNPVLKIIEKLSPYHRRHQEKSYPPHFLDHALIQSGKYIHARQYVGLVPFFCPRPLALFLKKIEGFIERLPLARQLSCAVYVVVASDTQAS